MAMHDKTLYDMEFAAALTALDGLSPVAGGGLDPHAMCLCITRLLQLLCRRMQTVTDRQTDIVRQMTCVLAEVSKLHAAVERGRGQRRHLTR